ncbi:MarC family protein [Roseiarcaceae bacterium H3SJ34-1]|uniref:MarC family protein n=1 Tax=Terripilifer ovatus TaxID=3032367 RepID=UPI003AB9884C|nr:MarC family protein [Roseiarcaceae bacterium H3SJ34-1]
MLDDYRLFTTQIVILWAVLDPLSHLTLFMGATTSLAVADRRRAAWLSVVIAFGILTGFALLGPLLLRAMGVSLLSFQIAGGVIVFLFAINMVLGEAHQGEPHQNASPDAGENATSIAIYPLATPIIAGPGSMLTILLLMDNNRYSAFQQAITIAALAVIMVALLGIFLAGEYIGRVLGVHGANLIRRIMGLILAALAVNMILSALALWLRLPEI